MFTTRTTSTIILVCLLLFGLLTGFCESQGPPGTPMNIRISDITSTSFVVQWDEVDDAKLYCVQWRDDGGSVRSRKSKPPQTSTTITQLSPSTTYNVTVYVTAGNICGTGPVSDILIVTTNVTILVGPLSSMLTMATPTSSSSVITTTPTSNSGSSGGGGGIIGGIVGGIIAVVLVIIIIIVVLYWFCVYEKKGGSDLEKDKSTALQSPTGKFAKDAQTEIQYDTVTRVVPYHTVPSGEEYALSTKKATMGSLNEPPLEYSYVTLDTKKRIEGIPDIQYVASTKAAEAKDTHYSDELRDEPGNVPHQSSASGAEYAVSTKAKAHQHDDVKNKTPQGVRH